MRARSPLPGAFRARGDQNSGMGTRPPHPNGVRYLSFMAWAIFCTNFRVFIFVPRRPIVIPARPDGLSGGTPGELFQVLGFGRLAILMRTGAL